MQYLHRICARSAQDLCRIRARSAQDPRKIRARSAQDLRKICARSVQDLRKIRTRSAQDLRKICARSAQDLRKIRARKYQKLTKFVRARSHARQSRKTPSKTPRKNSRKTFMQHSGLLPPISFFLSLSCCLLSPVLVSYLLFPVSCLLVLLSWSRAQNTKLSIMTAKHDTLATNGTRGKREAQVFFAIKCKGNHRCRLASIKTEP